ncbi:hypothetical protein [Psychroserpens ponticola]|uniref:Uncharacterized protein n=1 Tax=Psychroserpens ponticola TaxID=2932268 RepID=A0ABY7RTH1_9FLAO|nr:hypothetical protein [Psychroserpens ponticola]WCO00273.1 hypothetical protein MUN68_009325 [Psychroserpens ponticola]
MTNYSLNFISKLENLNSLNLPSELVDGTTLEKFGRKIKLIWRLYKLKDEKVWERIQEDEQNGIIYSEINTENLKRLTDFINVDFLSKLLEQEIHFNLKKLDIDSKYNLTFSLESDKNVVGVREMKWSNVNVIAFEYLNNEWINDSDNFWNLKKWSVVEIKEGYCEIKNVVQQRV